MKKVYLEITMQIDNAKRNTAGEVYAKYKQPFLNDVKGAKTKELLIRDEDVQVLHGFDSAENAGAYLSSTFFTDEVVLELTPLLKANPEIRIYSIA